MRDVLDWTHASAKGLDTGRHEARAAEMASRLKDEVAAGRLPFLSMPYWDGLQRDLEASRPFLQSFDHMLLLGIGGSALGARALQKAFFPSQDQPGHTGPSIWIADNVDAVSLSAWLDKLPARKTLVLAVSKSGDTIETTGQYFILKRWLQERLGEAWTGHLMFVTDARKGYFREEADLHKVRSLLVPDNLGGRYSVLSAVGLVPAVFLGIDAAALAAGARQVAAPLVSASLTGEDLASHPAFRLACWAVALMEAGFSEMIFFCYIPLWASFGDWFAQLWAESLGKQGKGSQPIPAVGVTDQHSVNQMFLDGPRNKACLFLSSPGLPAGPSFPAELPGQFSFIAGKGFGDLLAAEALGTRMSLTKSGVPLVDIRLCEPLPRQAGKLMALLGAATILSGWLLGINPVDQPAVELGKRLAKARMGAAGLTDETAALAAFLAAPASTTEF